MQVALGGLELLKGDRLQPGVEPTRTVEPAFPDARESGRVSLLKDIIGVDVPTQLAIKHCIDLSPKHLVVMDEKPLKGVGIPSSGSLHILGSTCLVHAGDDYTFSG